ncbi:MAG: sulfite exporter TauE/SafE family protein [Desulfomonilaceae bacterium]
MTTQMLTFPVGVTIATLATMVGLGGGVLWVPYLVLVAGLTPPIAIMTSLVIQIAGMASGGVATIRQDKTDIRLALILAASAFPGVAFGVWLQGVVNPQSLVFLVGLACMACGLVFVLAREDQHFLPAKEVSLRKVVPYLWTPPTLSVVTGLLSVGVGDFLVPVLRNRLRLRMDAAIGACLVVMTINAAAAFSLHMLAGGSFSGRIALFGTMGALVGGQIGPRIADKVPDQTLKEIFIYGLSLIGIHVLFNAV